MTLCIGAMCELDAPKIVVSCDLKGSTEVGSAENVYKLEKLSNLWWALIAGTVSTARELATYYRTYLMAHEGEINFDNALEYLHRPAEIFKDVARNRLAKRLTSLTYDEFIEHPERFSPGIAFELENINPDAHLIILGYMPDHADSGPEDAQMRLFKYANGEVFICDNHAAIGTGEKIAEAALLQREHTDLWTLPRTLYAVYEAQRLGWRAEGVGKEMLINIFEYDQKAKRIKPSFPRPNLMMELEAWWDRFGLREIDGGLQLPKDPLIYID
jgi:hypothetical protein